MYFPIKHYNTIPISKDVTCKFTTPDKLYAFKHNTKAQRRLRRLIKRGICREVKSYEYNLRTVEFIEFSMDNIMAFINNRLNEFWYRNGKAPETIILGRSELRELGIQNEIEADITINGEAQYRLKKYGIKVIFCPTIDGFVVI